MGRFFRPRLGKLFFRGQGLYGAITDFISRGGDLCSTMTDVFLERILTVRCLKVSHRGSIASCTDVPCYSVPFYVLFRFRFCLVVSGMQIC